MGQDIRNYKEHRMLVAIAYLCMLSLGLIMTFKGVVIPSIREEFMVDYSQIGQMLFFILLGTLIATFFAGILVEKYGLKRLFLLGIVAMIISNALFYFLPGFYGVVFIHFLLGIGLGCFQIAANVLGGKIFIRNSAMMMNLMHLFFGVGAALAPRYAGVFMRRGYSWQFIYLSTTALLIILMVLVLLAKFPKISGNQEENKVTMIDLAKSPKVWLIALTLGCFEIMEGGVTSWLVNYLQVGRSLDVAASTRYLTWFYIVYVFGRLVGGYIADRFGYIKSLFYFTIAATLILFAGIVSGDTLLGLFSLTGFFISIRYPTMMALIMKEYKNSAGTVMGFAITTGGICNMIGSRAIGNISDAWSVSAGMIAIGVSGIAASILLIILGKDVKH